MISKSQKVISDVNYNDYINIIYIMSVAKIVRDLFQLFFMIIGMIIAIAIHGTATSAGATISGTAMLGT